MHVAGFPDSQGRRPASGAGRGLGRTPDLLRLGSGRVRYGYRTIARSVASGRMEGQSDAVNREPDEIRALPVR